MKRFTAIVLFVLLISTLGCIKEEKSSVQNLDTTIIKKTKAKADFIFECKVIDESPLGHGKSIQKSYKVKYKALFFGLVGLELPDTIWIHYDSIEYSDELKSGKESEYHKGDEFIAYLDYKSNKKDFAFRILRLDEISQSGNIKKQLEQNP